MGAGRETWSEQLQLANRYRLLIPDRRSYGDSPPGDGDFERDAEDVAALLDDSHVVGHSYGGVVALLAAARRPDAVRSLTVIEPPALGLVRGRPEVEEFIRRVDSARTLATDGSDYAARFTTSFGFPAPSAPPEGRALDAATASWRERPPFEAVIPLDALAAAPFPKLVVRGAWDGAPDDARRIGKPSFDTVCDLLVERLRAQSATIAGVAHAAQRGEGFNEQLVAFWESA
jgi:pimeloyl-ACP methyl ester carboxylesterase